MKIKEETVSLIKEMFGVDIEDQAQRVYIAEKSLLALCLIYLGHHFELEPADFHLQLVDVLEDETMEAVEIIGFRGSAKTTYCSLAFLAWCTIFKKYNFLVLLNETTDQMKLNIASLKKEFEGNELLMHDFPKIRNKTFKWADQHLEFDDVYILGRSRGQKIRGLKWKQYRPQVIILDDPESLEWTLKKENRNKTERWFNSEVVPAQDELKCKMIIIGNLLHNDALMMRIKKRGIYKVLEFPLLDWKTGEITWTGKYPNMEVVEKQKKKIGSMSAWSREYLLKVISEEEQVIKEDEITKYPNHILSETDNDNRLRYPPKNGGTGIDLAISLKETADCTAMVSGIKVFYNGKDRVLIKPNPINLRLDFLQTQNTAKRQLENMPIGSRLYVEDVGYQKAAIQEMKRKGLPVLSMRPITDKKARLETIAPYVKDGSVLFPETGCEDLLTQLTNFGIEQHDDLVDALVYLILGLMCKPQGRVLVGKIDTS